MQKIVELQQSLCNVADAAFAGDKLGLAAAERWMTDATVRELLRIDAAARDRWWIGPALGDARLWTPSLLRELPPVAAAFASMHPDGHVREQAVRHLVASTELLATVRWLFEPPTMLRLSESWLPVRF